MLLHLLHLLLHSLDFCVHTALFQRNLRDVFVNVRLLLLTSDVTHADLLQVKDQILVLLCSLIEGFLGDLGCLDAVFLQLADLFFTEFQVLVKLVDQLWVLLLLRHDFLRLLLDVVSVDSHKAL